MENVVLERKRWHKARKMVWLLQSIPFIYLVGVTGSLAVGESRPDSDIDFFIVAKEGRLWTTRFLSTLVTHLVRQRRHGEKIAGRICLSRYLTEPYLKIQPQDYATAREFSRLVPLFDRGGVYSRLMAANSWIGKHFELPKNRPISVYSRGGRILRRFVELLLTGAVGDWVELKLRTIQLSRINRDPRTHQAGSDVYVDDQELRFHPEPRRESEDNVDSSP